MEIISPKMDFCVKELFANPVIRKYFISDVMGIPADTIRSVRLCNPYFYSYWDKRNLYYLSKMYTEDLRVGENYGKLKKAVSISILDFNLTDDPEYHSVYYLRDERGRLYTDLFEVHIIELGKKLNGNNSLDDWIRFFNASTPNKKFLVH